MTDKWLPKISKEAQIKGLVDVSRAWCRESTHPSKAPRLSRVADAFADQFGRESGVLPSLVKRDVINAYGPSRECLKILVKNRELLWRFPEPRQPPWEECIKKLMAYFQRNVVYYVNGTIFMMNTKVVWYFKRKLWRYRSIATYCCIYQSKIVKNENYFISRTRKNVSENNRKSGNFCVSYHWLRIFIASPFLDWFFLYKYCCK